MGSFGVLRHVYGLLMADRACCGIISTPASAHRVSIILGASLVAIEWHNSGHEEAGRLAEEGGWAGSSDHLLGRASW